MSEIWPLDVKLRRRSAAVQPIRPFNCLMLMPFEKRFDQIAEIIKTTVSETLKVLDSNLGINPELPQIERLDWVTSSGVIHQEIWEKVLDADLVFCDLTGYNPNVMFEVGVCAAWKDMVQVVFIKDHFFRQPAAFDIEPVRYTEYELTTDGIGLFREKVFQLTQAALIRYPNMEVCTPPSGLPLEISFKDDRDDLRIYTPPYAHRRVVDGRLEFGSIFSFAHSWASVGNQKVYTFNLKVVARFSNPTTDNSSWIGVAVRSQHFFANYSHLLYLTRDGRIVITEPNEDLPPEFFTNNTLRGPTKIDLEKDHTFEVKFTESTLSVTVDDFSREFEVRSMRKVFGPGLIRLQTWKSWMALKQVKLTV